MANIAVAQIPEPQKEPLPFFQELEKRFEQVRRRAFELFETRGRESGRDFDDWMRAEREVAGWPAAELAEENGEYKLEMTLPGFDPKEVEIAATPSEILVHAEIKPQKKAGDHILWTEFGANNVCRRFQLPQPIDVSKTKATLEHGLLKIIAGKAPTVRPTSIPVG